MSIFFLAYSLSPLDSAVHFMSQIHISVLRILFISPRFWLSAITYDHLMIKLCGISKFRHFLTFCFVIFLFRHVPCLNCISSLPAPLDILITNPIVVFPVNKIIGLDDFFCTCLKCFVFECLQLQRQKSSSYYQPFQVVKAFDSTSGFFLNL